MSRKGFVFINNINAGIIEENDEEFCFTYLKEFLEGEKAVEISITLPLQEEPFYSKSMFSFTNNINSRVFILYLIGYDLYLASLYYTF